MTPPDTRPVLYTDLDDTLFQTARKMPEPVSETRLAAIATNGHHSYMTEAQHRMTRWLLAAMRVIPVTARSTDALSRCQIPFESWKIAANGAVILDRAGTPDPDWSARIRAVSDAARDGLEALDAAVSANNGADRLRHWIVTEAGMPVYFCVKSNSDEAWLDDIEQTLRDIAGAAFRSHRNGNNLSYTPHGISKLDAVLAVEQKIGGDAPRFGMGDSLTDLPFMGVCTMMMIPPGSQIDAAIGRP